ncbi:hypothetical protein GF351_03710, partial [Candidatus Woesearchaeota archaeon]|nr:hypothetical protein [Candidatus Woesearchaeota archaeon]
MAYLEFKQVERILKEFDIPMQKTALAQDEHTAAELAEKIGYPIALKIESPDITHKSDAGGVITSIKDRKEILSGFRSIIKKVRKKEPKARIEGVMVQKMCTGD